MGRTDLLDKKESPKIVGKTDLLGGEENRGDQGKKEKEEGKKRKERKRREKKGRKEGKEGKREKEGEEHKEIYNLQSTAYDLRSTIYKRKSDYGTNGKMFGMFWYLVVDDRYKCGRKRRTYLKVYGLQTTVYSLQSTI